MILHLEPISPGGLMGIARLVFLLAISATLTTDTIPVQAQGSPRPTSFQLYYGGEQNLLDSMRNQFQSSQIVVIDIRGLTAYQFGQLRRDANEASATLIAYISIGELHSRELGLFEAFAKMQDPSVDFAKLKSQVFISENKAFSSYHADVSNQVWCDFIFHKTKNILATGVDGLFLDTVDTCDVYARKKEWDLDRRSKSVTAMIELIRDLKKLDGSPFVMQNRGLNLIGDEIFVGDAKGQMIPGQSLAKPHPENPDAILYEDAFSATGDWSIQVIKKLDAIQVSKQVTVVALGYEAVIKNKAQFLEKARRHQFVPAWSKDSHSLHLEIAR